MKTFGYYIFVPLQIESSIWYRYTIIIFHIHFYYAIVGRFLTVLNINNSSDYPMVHIMLYFRKSLYKIRWMSIYHILNYSVKL